MELHLIFTELEKLTTEFLWASYGKLENIVVWERGARL